MNEITQPKPKPISRKVREAINFMVTTDGKSGTVTAAALHAGLTREHLSRELGRPHVAALLRQKVSATRNQCRQGRRDQGQLLDCDNAMVKDRASTFILGLAGIQPATQPSVNVNIEVRAGYVIDLSDDPARPPKVIDHV